MNSTPRPAIDISRFEFRIALVCLLTWIGTLGLGDEARGQDLAGDRQALVAFYNATDGANWRNNRNWLSDEPLDAWYGVTVSDGRVTELDLWRNRLTGPIPAELENLSSLTDLFLYRNQLTGPIPAELGDLSSLRALSLSANQLTGPIPAELGNLSSLTVAASLQQPTDGADSRRVGSLSSLKQLSLQRGPFPQEGPLQPHGAVSRGNRLTGPIPARVGGPLQPHGAVLQQPRGRFPPSWGTTN